MHIHILQAVQQHSLRTNKDTNGGFGTVNDFGRGPAGFFLGLLKRRTMNFPELLPAYVHAILKAQGHSVSYAVNDLHPQADLVLLQTSIVNYSTELSWARRIRRQQPGMRLGFIGGMSAANPQMYLDQGDFVIVGEAESALLRGEIGDFAGLVAGDPLPDLDVLPFPDWSHLPAIQAGYGFLRTGRGRFLPMLSSRGCPMSCSYYCTYPLVQGASFRARTPQNVVAEIAHLQQRYAMTTVMFRDPIFSLDRTRVERICELILEQGLKLSWICETHPRCLTPGLVALMARAGCAAVKLGIESGDLDVMKRSRRAAPDLDQQEAIVRCLEAHGIDVLGFYILGYFDDTPASIARTLQYAEYLNTYGAQFTIATPYPGTPWYAELSRQPERFQMDGALEHYNQYRLVYNHPHLSFDDLERLKSQAYRRYYLRWNYIQKHLLHRHLSFVEPSRSAGTS